MKDEPLLEAETKQVLAELLRPMLGSDAKG